MREMYQDGGKGERHFEVLRTVARDEQIRLASEHATEQIRHQPRLHAVAEAGINVKTNVFKSMKIYVACKCK